MKEPTHDGEMASEKFKSPLRQYIASGILLIAGTGLSVTLFVVFRDHHRANVVDEFRTLAAGCVSAIRTETDQQMLVLKALQLFYNGSQKVERSEFHDFAEPLLQRYPRIQALEWIPVVPASQRESYELAAGRDGLHGYVFTDRKTQGVMVPSPRREEYFPVYFVEPHKGNEMVSGFDVGSSPARMEALRLSGETGDMVVTGRIRLVQDKSDRSGFLVLAPVYRKSSAGVTHAPSFENLLGFVGGAFQIDDIIENVLGQDGAQDMDLSVTDASGPSGQSLYGHSLLHDQSHRDSDLCCLDEDVRDIGYQETINVGGKQWTVSCRPTYAFVLARSSREPVAMLGLGLLLSCLAAFYMIQMARYAGRMIATNRNLAGQIIHRKQAEEALTASNRDLVRTTESLEATNRELTDFVYIASHDLREPLRKVSCFSSLLQESLNGKLEGDDQENLQFMVDGANRMADMIDGLLRYSRLNTTEESSQTIDLNEMVEQLERVELSAAIEESGAMISLPTALPSVHADAPQLRQLLQNLISNAIKYRREEQPPQIEITAGAPENGWVRIEVRDNGIGIPEQYRAGVFKMFKRLHSRQEFEGTGIGLAICRRILDRHGGQIGVEANEPCGSTFWFTMQMVEAPITRATPVGVA